MTYLTTDKLFAVLARLVTSKALTVEQVVASAEWVRAQDGTAYEAGSQDLVTLLLLVKALRSESDAASRAMVSTTTPGDEGPTCPA